VWFIEKAWAGCGVIHGFPGLGEEVGVAIALSFRPPSYNLYKARKEEFRDYM